MQITASVGRNAPNWQPDVKFVQEALNKSDPSSELRPDGIIGPKTISLIEEFQRKVVKISRPDGRIDPNGKTFLKLIENICIPWRQKISTINFNLSVPGSNLLLVIETLRLKPYDDQTGRTISNWTQGATIGYGHLLQENEWAKYSNGITKSEAEALFSSDLFPFVEIVRSKVIFDISQNQFDALVIFAFNIGVSAFVKSSVLKLVNDSNAITSYSDLQQAWKAWNKSEDKINNGLNNRRSSEWKIYSESRYEIW